MLIVARCLIDSQRYVHFIKQSVGQNIPSHENMIINLTPWREPHTLWFYQMRLRSNLGFIFGLCRATAKPQQSGGESQAHSNNRAKKNFDISQVVRENCCIFVLTLYFEKSYSNNRAKNLSSLAVNLSSVQNSTI